MRSYFLLRETPTGSHWITVWLKADSSLRLKSQNVVCRELNRSQGVCVRAPAAQGGSSWGIRFGRLQRSRSPGQSPLMTPVRMLSLCCCCGDPYVGAPAVNKPLSASYRKQISPRMRHPLQLIRTGEVCRLASRLLWLTSPLLRDWPSTDLRFRFLVHHSPERKREVHRLSRWCQRPVFGGGR